MAQSAETQPTKETTQTAPASTPSAEHKEHSKKKPMKLWLGVGAVALLAVGGVMYFQNQAKPAVTEHHLKLGLMTAGFSGGGIEDSVKLARTQMAVEGYDIEIISKITNCDPDTTAKAMDELVKAGVVAVIGEQCSGATLAAAPLANANQIPLLSPASSSPKVSDAGDYVFRTIPSDALASDFTANYLYNEGKVRNLAIIYGNEPYGLGLKDGVKANFEKLGGKVVAVEAIPDDNPNVAKITTQLTTVKAAKPDAIYVASSFAASNVALVVKMKALGITTPIYGSETFSDAAFIKDAGATANGLLILNVSQGTPEFIEKSNAAWKTDPQVYAAQAYDAYTALAKTFAKGAYTGAAIRDGLMELDFDGVSGHIKFDKNGDVAGNYSVFIIKDGAIKPLAQ